MSDLINRKEATTLPVMPKRYRKYQTFNLDDVYEQGWYDLQSCIEKIPSTEHEIIRCKDCKHRDTENGFCEGRGWPMQLVPDDGFCDKGERSK